ncbi:hypothetical protein DL93DRAFT_2075748, partial [Clavulina sp. PMI_390]
MEQPDRWRSPCPWVIMLLAPASYLSSSRCPSLCLNYLKLQVVAVASFVSKMPSRLLPPGVLSPRSWVYDSQVESEKRH